MRLKKEIYDKSIYRAKLSKKAFKQIRSKYRKPFSFCTIDFCCLFIINSTLSTTHSRGIITIEIDRRTGFTLGKGVYKKKEFKPKSQEKRKPKRVSLLHILFQSRN